MSRTDIATLAVDRRRVSLANLKPDTSYNVRVVAVNGIGTREW